MYSKGKYQLFTYKLEKYLIFYPSINSNQNIMAFSIISIQEVNDIIELVKEFVEKRIIYYFSLQVKFNLQKSIVLCFRDKKKENIIKSFYILKNKIDSLSNKIEIYRDKALENNYFDLMINWNNINIEINEKLDALKITNSKKERILKMYSLELRVNNHYDNEFLACFIKILKNYFIKGTLVFNFKYNEEYEFVCAPFLLLLFEIDEKDNAESIINDFYEYEILKTKKLYLGDIILILWRRSDKDAIKNVGDLMKILNVNPSQKKEIFQKFLNKITKIFNDNCIEYHQINERLILVMKKYLIVLISSLNYNDIRKILEKFYAKYSIYLITFNNSDQVNLSKIEKIRDLKRLKIISFKDFTYEKL